MVQKSVLLLYGFLYSPVTLRLSESLSTLLGDVFTLVLFVSRVVVRTSYSPEITLS